MRSSGSTSWAVVLTQQAAQRPRLWLASEFQRGGDVEQHPLCEEGVDRFVRCTAITLHRDVERSELLADDLANVLVATRGIGLELDAEQVPIGEQLHVGVAHQVEDRTVLVVVGLAPGGLVEDQSRPLEAATNDRQEQFPLRAEQLEQVWLRDADGPRDRFGRGSDVTARRELVDGRGDDGVSSLVGGLALRAGSRGGVHDT